MELLDKIKNFEIFKENWVYNVNLLGICEFCNYKEEIGIFLFKSHDQLYSLKISSNVVDLSFDKFLEDTNLYLTKHSRIEELNALFSSKSFKFFIPNTDNKKISIKQIDDKIDFNFFYLYLDTFYKSSAITLDKDILKEINKKDFLNNILQEMPSHLINLEQLIDKNKKKKDNHHISNEDLSI